jgi:hypothetical protein
MRPGEEGLNGTHGFPECFAAVAALLSMRATSPVGYAPRSEKRGTEEAVGGGRRARRQADGGVRRGGRRDGRDEWFTIICAAGSESEHPRKARLLLNTKQMDNRSRSIGPCLVQFFFK